jgi:lipoyl(octanoyl) transferase
MKSVFPKYKVKLIDLGICDFKKAWDFQISIFDEIISWKKSVERDKKTPPAGALIFVEHPHVYTLGKSGSESNMLLDSIQIKAKDASFYKIDRGGDITYHGPGQIICYPIFDIEALNIGLKEYIYKLEMAIIDVVGEYGLKSSRLEGAAGVWLDPDVAMKARKICAIGVKASRFVTMHGLAFNVNTNLEYFNFINPCGFTDKSVTSLEKELGKKQNIDTVKKNISKKIIEIFNLEVS